MRSNTIKKTIYTLNTDNYAPEITRFTYPFLRQYAQKIGAEFFIIEERKYPELPPVYEKLQIYDYAREHHNDWNIYIDSDALVHPDMFDVTTILPRDTVLHYSSDFAPIRWRYNHVFLRDGRNIGSGNWFTIASDWCRDLWHPPEISYEEALACIHPINQERLQGIIPSHLIDDFLLSYNIARFGLKFTTYLRILNSIDHKGQYLWHHYEYPLPMKIQELKQTIRGWGLIDLLEEDLRDEIHATTQEEQTGQFVEGTIPFRIQVPPSPALQQPNIIQPGIPGAVPMLPTQKHATIM